MRRLLLPVRSLGDELFRGEGARLLLAGNAAHADIPVDSPGSGLMGMLLVMLGQELGFPVPRGGAGRLAEAMAARLELAGGAVRTSCRVAEVVVERGRAAGVRTADGERIGSRRCIIADVSAPALYGGLVDWRHLPPRLQKRMERFEWDPGTVKVDWALDGPIPWTGAPKEAPGTVHLAPSVDALGVAGAEVAAGVVPMEGLVLVGQMATTDSSRAPAGAESVWAYTHVPSVVRHTSPASAGLAPIERGPWSRASAERMADRVQARMELQAPGFGDRIVARRVLGPTELESLDDNLRGGALNGGTAALQQQLVFRPVPDWGERRRPSRGSFWARPRRIQVEESTARAAPTRPAQRWRTRGSPAGASRHPEGHRLPTFDVSGTTEGADLVVGALRATPCGVSAARAPRWRSRSRCRARRWWPAGPPA